MKDGGAGGHVGSPLHNVRGLRKPTESVFVAVWRRGGTEPTPYTEAGRFCGRRGVVTPPYRGDGGRIAASARWASSQ